MSRNWEEAKKKMLQRRNQMMQILSSREKLLEVIRDEGLCSEFLTVSETDDGGLLACDNFRHLQLWMRQQDDGSVALAWGEEGRPVSRREVYDDPSRGYYEFFMELQSSKNMLEEVRAEADRRGQRFRDLPGRFFKA